MAAIVGIVGQDNYSRGSMWAVGLDGAGKSHPASSPARNFSVVVLTGSMMILDVEPKGEHRRQVQIQNLSESYPVHINLGTGAATTSHYRINPGQTYMFATGVSYDGMITAIAAGGNAEIAIIEFYHAL